MTYAYDIGFFLFYSTATWTRRSVTSSCASSAPARPVSSSPPICSPEVSMCSKSASLLTTNYPSRRRTTSIELEEPVDLEEREQQSTSSFQRTLVSSRTFKITTTRRLTRCRPISTSCEWGLHESFVDDHLGHC